MMPNRDASRGHALWILLALAAVAAAVIATIVLMGGRDDLGSQDGSDGESLRLEGSGAASEAGSAGASDELVNRSSAASGREGQAGAGQGGEDATIWRESPRTRMVARVLEKASGDPVAGVRIEVHRRHILRDVDSPEELFKRRPLALAESDAAGRVFLPREMHGYFYLDAVGPEYHSTQELRIDLNPAVEPAPAELQVALGGRVRGVLRDALLRPIGEGVVFAMPGMVGVLEIMKTGYIPVRIDEVDEQGRYELPALPSGAGWRVIACGGNFAPGTSDPFDIVPGGTSVVDIRTEPPRLLEGEVVDAGGQPVAGAVVRYSPKMMGAIMLGDLVSEIARPLMSAVTDEQGRFSLRGMPAAKLEIWASHPQHAYSRVQEVDLKSRSEVSVRIELQPALALRGRVFDAGGRALPGVAVSYLGTDEGGEILDEKERVHTKTDAQGRFQLRCIPRDEKERLEAHRGSESFGGLLAAQPEVAVAETGAAEEAVKPAPKARLLLRAKGFVTSVEELPFPSEKEEVLLLHQGQSIRGQVLVSGSREPVGEFLLSIESRGLLGGMERGLRIEHKLPFASPDGRFATDPDYRGKLRLALQARGYHLEEREIEIGDEPLEELVFELRKGAELRGVVKNSQGLAVAGAKVSVGGHRNQMELTMRDEEGLMEVVSGDDGGFRFEGLSRSMSYVHVEHEEYIDLLNQSIEWKDDQPASMELVMHRGGGIHGLVSDKAGLPLEGRVVAAFSMQGGKFGTATSLGDGSYRIERLEPGKGYSLALLDKESEFGFTQIFTHMKASNVKVVEGESTEVDLVEEGGGCRLSGRLVDAKGHPVPEGFIVLTAEDATRPSAIWESGSKMTRTDGEGRFEIKGVQEGRYMLRYGSFGFEEDERLAGREPIEIGSESTREIELRIPGSRIQGEVLSQADGKPVQGVQLTLVPLEGADRGNLLFRSMYEVRSGEDGKFAFASVPLGSYRIRAKCEYSRVGDTGLAETLSDPIHVQSPSGTYEARIALRAGCRIDVEVVDALTREPVRGALVFVDYEGNPQLLTEERTQSQGQAELRGLRPGAVEVLVQAEGYREARSALTLGEEGAKVPLTLALTRGATLEVTVKGDRLRRISGARVEVKNAAGEILQPRASNYFFGQSMGNTFVTNGSGVFETGLLQPGSYTVQARMGDQESEVEKVEIPDTGTVKLRLRLR